MRTLWPYLVLAAVAGCGEVVSNNPDASGDGPIGGDPDDGLRSGTRLKLQWYDFGGTRVASGQRDTLRDETCYPQAWADGRTYCMPNSAMSVAFSDAGCTQRVGVQYVDPACPSTPSTYLLEYAPDLCESYPDRLYQRGAMISASAHYYLQPDGSCNGPYSDPNYRYYSAGGVVATSALIEMTESAPSTATRYSQRFYESTDGARVFSRVHDRELDTACYLGAQSQDATSGTCTPNNAYYASYFQDSQCLQPKLDVSSACPAPRFAVTYPTGQTCPGEFTPTYYPVGGMADTTVFRDDGGSCTAQTASPEVDYYALGPALSLPGVPRVRDAVAGRRIQLTHYHDGATRLRDYTTYDEMLGTVCYPFQQQDQTIVCMPFQYGISTYYTDPACTTPIDLIEQYRGEASCATPTPPEYAVKYMAGGCGYTYEVHTVGTMLSSAIYQDSGGCNLYTAPQSVFFRAGPVVPTSQLATATLVIDP
jgi:hypothetical protein